jgi:hypothetical protein
VLPLVVACAAPVYDDDLGIQAIPADVGALAGTFGYKSVSAVQWDLRLPGLEELYGGTENHRLVVRTWDPTRGSYSQTTQLCGGEEYEVAGIAQTYAPSAWRAVPESTSERVVVDHARGTYSLEDQVQVWGALLPDPVSTVLPRNMREAEEPPHVERVYDMDGDGNPGYTTHFSGFLNGDWYALQRRTIALEGITLGRDRLLGLIRTEYEFIGLGGEYDENENPPPPEPDNGQNEDDDRPLFVVHPDPKESWFEEVRIPDGSTCDDVMALESDGDISRLRPF